MRVDKALVEKELARRSGMPVRVNNDQGNSSSDSETQHEGLVPIEPLLFHSHSLSMTIKSAQCFLLNIALPL